MRLFATISPVPRTATLKPLRRKSRKSRGLASWVVNVPAVLSDTGKRQELFFETEKKASAECEKLKARKDNFGHSLSSLTAARMSEAAEAYKLLGDSATLLDAVRGYLTAQKIRQSSISFVALFNQFLEAKKDRNEQYRRELRVTRNRFPTLHDILVSDITHRELEHLLSAITPGGRNAVMRYLRAVFNLGIKRGYLFENPIARLDFAERPRKEVETLSNKAVKAMLGHAAEKDLVLLPFLVLGLFCGIRPDGELQKIEWQDVDLNDKIITIRPEVSKTNRRRFIDLSDNAKNWIQYFIKRAGIQRGPVVTMTESELRRHRTANWTAAGIKKWPQQGMRHTYCSNWLAVHKEINKLVLQSGHDSVDTMWRHYHRGTTEAQAQEFWSIVPATKPEPKVIPLPLSAAS
jgi:integrase